MKNMLRTLMMLLLSLVILTGCSSLISRTGKAGIDESGASGQAKFDRGDDDSLYFIAANDLHYLASSLNDRETMEQIARTGDYKVVHYADLIVEAFIDEVICQRPDALLLMGDLTYNGEAQSHIDLAKLLDRVQESGIPVGLLPGNHDIEMPFSYGFVTGEAVPTDTVSYEEFYGIYGDFGYNQAELKDATSFSYMMELSDDIWVVLLDCNAEGTRGRVSKDTLNWLVGSLEEARRRGKTVISATHQSLNVHNEMLTDGFLIENNEVIRDIYEYYDVRFNLTGHLHVQHLALDPGGLSEASTGALPVSPNNIAHVLIDRDLNVTYRTRPVDVAGWSKEKGIKNPDLLNFFEYSRDFFTSICKEKTSRMFKNRTDLTPREIQTLVTFFSEANADYFAGDLCATCEGLTEDQAFRLWQEKAGDTWIFQYMESYLYDPPKNHNKANFSIAP